MKDWFTHMPDLNVSAVVLSKRPYLYRMFNFFFSQRHSVGHDITFWGYLLCLSNILHQPILRFAATKHVTDGQTDKQLDRHQIHNDT